MEILHIENYTETRFDTAIALGNFDGVHVGHQALIKRMIDKARFTGLRSSILLFENHTKAFLDGTGPALISSSKQKNDLISNLGVETIYAMKFDENVMKLTPEEFIVEILVKRLNVKAIVVGYDYRFGNKASGDSNLLKELGSIYNIDVEILHPVIINDEVVSSTRIRNLIKEGKLEDVKLLLNREYSIKGKVVPGKKIGNKLGFPTANIEPDINYVIPKLGVYSTEVIIDDKKYLSATSVGYNPTFEEATIKIETHIIDFKDDIYNKEIELIFIEYLRNEIKFSTIDSLVEQISIDIAKVKSR
ncbi:bifunctional riboflavin kinase/FAD synthetase [Tissierella sp. Yu-01]|uniref:bifunctional riboflavin kinase/FAD synthetase n=1 Tax=Tissierella sp. Yu-01 TaxID=3035694 RepID=UPI00240D2D64|nr:bifunctional riboflavin kinase/FAD synthetase [Tissierella sp. Yu-01]WFA09758.1 bifunctional riboflavin kinase/FAD synthetase [Tissierella sp. Yu-01]